MSESTRLLQRPSDRSRKAAEALVLVVNSIERLAFYGITSNFVLFLNKAPYNWMSYNASSVVFIFLGLANIFCLVGGFLSDSYLGRFKTMVLGLIIYMCGYTFFPLFYPNPSSNHVKNVELYFCPATRNHDITNHTNLSENMFQSPVIAMTANMSMLYDAKIIKKEIYKENCSAVVLVALIVTAIGCGIFKANIAPFGADQVQMSTKDGQRTFFNWFYWSVNIGSLLAYTGVSFIQQEISFFIGYLIPYVLLGIGTFIFCLGGVCKIYNLRRPCGSVFNNIFGVIKEACILCRQKTGKRNRLVNSIIEYHEHTDKEHPASCLDHAKTRHGGSYHDAEVDDVKKLGRVMLVFLSLIPYWAVYFQMQTNYLVQGLHMCLSLNCSSSSQESDIEIPASFLAIFDVVFIIIFIPIMTKWVYPKLEKMGCPLSLTSRIVLGMIFAIISMLCAGGLETWRLSSIYQNASAPFEPTLITNRIGNDNYNASELSIFLQIPQYATIGLSEIFTSIAGLELAYSKAPRTMQGIIMGLFLFFCGVGSFVGTVTMSIFYGIFFFSDDKGNINCRIPCADDNNKVCQECRLDKYFYVLAGLQIFGLILFLVIAKFVGFTVKNPSHRSIEDDRKRPRSPDIST